MLVQLRRGSLLQDRFPELLRAATVLPRLLVLDGELVVWVGDQMSSESLQRRTADGDQSPTNHK